MASQNDANPVENFTSALLDGPELDLSQNSPDIREEISSSLLQEWALVQNGLDIQEESQETGHSSFRPKKRRFINTDNQGFETSSLLQLSKTSKMENKLNGDGVTKGRSTQVQRMLEVGKTFYLPLIGGGGGGNLAKLIKERKIRKILFKERIANRYKQRAVGDGLIIQKEDESRENEPATKQRKLGTTDDEIDSKAIFEALESYEFYTYIS